jgi:hypothetical protein
MHSDYVNPAIRQLRDQQVRFAPREKKLDQVAQAERLLTELDPARVYPYEYICYRITNYRPESYPDLKLTGQRRATTCGSLSRTCRNRLRSGLKPPGNGF